MGEDRPTEQSLCPTRAGLHARIPESELGEGRTTQHRGRRTVHAGNGGRRDGREVRPSNGAVCPRALPDCIRSALQTTAGPDQCECTRYLPACLRPRRPDHPASGIDRLPALLSAILGRSKITGFISHMMTVGPWQTSKPCKARALLDMSPTARIAESGSN